MCGRYVVTNAVLKTREIVKSAISVKDTYNFNASPQQKFPVINNRCLVVADGYYEWKREKIGKHPYYFTRFDNKSMYFAGIYKYHQFIIITMQADFNTIDIHHRQPVIINEKDLNNYFDLKKKETSFLKSYKTPKLKFHPVSKDVNNLINNTKELIEELK